MATTFVKNYIHFVFSTKHRQPLIIETVQPQLFNYIEGICHNLECPAIAVGGVTDHIHLLCNVSKKMPVAKLMQEVKANSSRWMKTQYPRLQHFSWQDGYGAFSVNPSEVDVVVRYIENQKEHHAKKSFQQEFVQFLVKYDVAFDERYLWG